MTLPLPLPQPQPPPQRCENCPHGFAVLVGGRGAEDSPVVIVGESPGKEEVKAKLPFVGPTGKVLDHALVGSGINLEKPPLLLNAMQCYPGSTKNKNLGKLEIATQCCQKRLYAEIQKHPRKIILAMGNPAAWSLTNQFGLKITQVRGKLWSSPLAENGILTTIHPAFILRGGGSMRQFCGDVTYALQLTAGSLADHGKRYVLPSVHVAKTIDNVKWLAAQIRQQPYCAADIETGGYEGFDHLRDRTLMCGFAWDPHHVYIVPEQLIPKLGIIFDNCPRTKFIWHNGKFDIKFLWAAKIWGARVDEDNMLCSYALDETKGIHDLEQISSDLLGAPDWKYMVKEYLGKGKTYADIPTPVLYDYAARDISGTLQCFQMLRPMVAADPGLEKLYTEMLIPATKYMARIEFKGLKIDPAQIEQNQNEKETEAQKLEGEFNALAVQTGFGMLNIRSPLQVGPFLYDTLKLRDPRKPNKRPVSTDEDTLNTLPPVPAVKTLLRYREVQKGLSTYVKALPKHVGADGRVHTTYLIHGTTTGRPASRNPNILNIPRDPKLRGQFVADKDCIFMEIDVNQAELRVLAELSRDPTLVQIYTVPGFPSIHKVTQLDMFGDPGTYKDQDWTRFMEKFSTHGDPARTLDEQNMRAKCVNFGIIYGRTAPSIAEEFKMPTDEAQIWINKWFAKYPIAREFIMKCRQAPLKGQNLITPFGRKRRFQVVNYERLNDIQNQAANFPEQSIASDVVTKTGIKVQDMARWEYNAFLVNTVYDSLLFELPNDIPKALELGNKVLGVLAETAVEWGLTLIPFKGDIKIGNRWGYLEKLKPNQA